MCLKTPLLSTDPLIIGPFKMKTTFVQIDENLKLSMDNL
jgi:hypothetical protein